MNVCKGEGLRPGEQKKLFSSPSSLTRFSSVGFEKVLSHGQAGGTLPGAGN